MTDLPTYPLTVDGVTAACRYLDLESWEIAEIATDAGVEGVPGNECACILAVLFGLLIPDAEEVFVEAWSVRVKGTIRDDIGFDVPAVVSCDLPPGCTDLIADFDALRYPALIAKPITVEEVDAA